MSTSETSQARIQAIAKELALGKKRQEIVTKYVKKWQCSARSVDRIIDKAKGEAATLTTKAGKAAEQVIITEAVEAVKIGLKTKHERIVNLQLQCDTIIAEIAAGTVTVTTYQKNKRVDRVYLMTPEQKTAHRKNLRDLQAEISKIEGDYAAEKKEVNLGGSFMDFLMEDEA